ncbi:uncharacterized protein LOC132941308 isoform X2 [Metopolophium dirhodum]|uniref:uncharacterized protein LOC132941308 isoform X2 n=1 Tax=Metopolophium dirhodum TaxID=44670 RepID=UPI0029900D7E|nr:uncharacterized protein LOC132941308 isoform X2 [Metopolophium dirhodum]
MDYEDSFLKKYNIMKLDEYIELYNNRSTVNKKITENVITKRELLSHFRVELSLLNACKLKIKDELEKTHDVIDTQILVFLCNHAFILFRNIHVFFSIEEDLLSLFINFCQDNVSYINVNQLDILLAVVMRVPNNQNIWIQLIKLHLTIDSFDHDKLMVAFSQGVRALNDSLPLWKILIRNLRYRRPEIVETLLKEATKGTEDFYDEKLSLEIRPKYLEWCIEFKDIHATRDLFNELKDFKPACPKLYLVMIAIEREEPNYELDTVRQLYEEVTKLCGNDNVEVWIDYIRFEQEYGNKGLKQKIYYKAVFNLQRQFLDTLFEQHESLEREFCFK